VGPLGGVTPGNIRRSAASSTATDASLASIATALARWPGATHSTDPTISKPGSVGYS